MKNLINALRMSVVFAILIFFAACTQNNSHTPVPDPNPVPTGSEIVRFSISEDSINYDGQLTPGTVNVSWDTKNAIVYLNDSVVAKNGSLTTGAIFQNKKFTLRVTDLDGKNVKSQSLDVVVSVDPLFQKICGTSGTTWIIDSSFSYAPGGSPESNLTPCVADDKVTLYPNGLGVTDQGDAPNCLTGLIVGSYTFNKSDTTLQFYPVAFHPNRKVIFLPNDKIHFEYQKSGKTWVQVYRKV